MITPQIEKNTKMRIYNALNKFIDDYIGSKTLGTRSARTIIAEDDYNKYIAQQSETPKTILDFKNEIKKEKNIAHLIDSIGKEGMNLFNSELEYKNYVRSLLIDIVKDRTAEFLDKKEPVMERKVMNFSDFINESETIYKAGDKIKCIKSFSNPVDKKNSYKVGDTYRIDVIKNNEYHLTDSNGVVVKDPIGQFKIENFFDKI